MWLSVFTRPVGGTAYDWKCIFDGKGKLTNVKGIIFPGMDVRVFKGKEVGKLIYEATHA